MRGNDVPRPNFDMSNTSGSTATTTTARHSTTTGHDERSDG